MRGWQSESTNGPKGGWSCAFWSGCNGCSGHLTQLLDVVWCNGVVVVVAEVVVAVVLAAVVAVAVVV